MRSDKAAGAPELLPCPFCGAEMGPHDGMRWVLCVECGAESGRQIDAASAIAAWNRRATTTALAASPEVQKLIREAEARAEKAHEKEIAVWSENYASLQADRDKWFEGAGAHHVASMQQAQRADRAKAALSAAQQRIKLLCDNDEWNLGLQEALEVIRTEAAAILEEPK